MIGFFCLWERNPKRVIGATTHKWHEREVTEYLKLTVLGQSDDSQSSLVSQYNEKRLKR